MDLKGADGQDHLADCREYFWTEGQVGFMIRAMIPASTPKTAAQQVIEAFITSLRREKIPKPDHPLPKVQNGPRARPNH